jgi:hypothetical protein
MTNETQCGGGRGAMEVEGDASVVPSRMATTISTDAILCPREAPIDVDVSL